MCAFLLGIKTSATSPYEVTPPLLQPVCRVTHDQFHTGSQHSIVACKVSWVGLFPHTRITKCASSAFFTQIHNFHVSVGGLGGVIIS